jgi:hypothetical protein
VLIHRAFRVWDGIYWLVRVSSLHVTNTTYSGLQEHRIIVGVGPESFLLLLLQSGTASTIAWEYLGCLGSWQKKNWADTKAGIRKLEVQGEGPAHMLPFVTVDLQDISLGNSSRACLRSITGIGNSWPGVQVHMNRVEFCTVKPSGG